MTIDGRLRKMLTLDSYDQTNGNLLHSQAFDGTTSAYTWDSNSGQISSLMKNPGDATQMVSNYTFKPLVGLSQVVDPNGRASNYEYDAFSRLRLTRDNDNNILSRYRYHYVNQNEEFNSVISVSGDRVISGVITLTSTDPDIGFGVNTYAWDFGDGNTASGSSSVSHSYSAAGTYTVRVTKTNPERSPMTVTGQVIINPPFLALICANGPVSIDLCGAISPSYGNCAGSTNNTPTSTTVLNASVTGGCGTPLTYTWDYQIGSTGAWQSLAPVRQ